MAGSRRLIRIVHASTGRLRLRLTWLRAAPQEATALADHLAALSGMRETAVRPWTGSVLCQYDPKRLDEGRIVAAVQRQTSVTFTVRPGEDPPPRLEPLQGNAPGSSLSRAVAQSFAAVNEEVLALTDGRLDLGVLTSLGFMTAGAAEIAISQRLPAPPWFNLAWWAVRTFTTFERETTKPASGLPPTPGSPRSDRQVGPRRQGAKRRRKELVRSTPAPRP